MTAFRTHWRRRIAPAVTILAMSVGLVACGGDSSPAIVDTTPIPPVVTPPPVSTVDQFFAYVAARVLTLLDTDEPLSIDQVVSTTPDNTEPETVTP